MQHRKIPQTVRQQNSACRKGPHPTDRHVGNRVARLRLRARLTQAELAIGVGVSVQQIQKYENATNRISASMLHQIATILGVAVGQLFDGLPEGPTDKKDVPPHQDEHLAFLSSPDGKRLNDGLLALSPRVRRHLATLIETVGAEISVAPPVSGEGEG